MPADPVDDWVDALVRRHTSTLSRPEFLKAVRALSARYVERRSDISERSPVDSAGKRAAFAAFFAPLHLLAAREIARALGAAGGPMPQLIDLGCGTGAASAGWALACDRAPAILGIDRRSWSLDEAAWNWRALGLRGRTRRADLVRTVADLARQPVPPRGTSLVAAWSINELDRAARGALLPALLTLVGRGYRALVIEPLARRAVPWWDEWSDRWQQHGGRAAEWKIERALPPVLADLSDAAGFRRDSLGARTLWIDRTPMLRSGDGVRRTRPLGRRAR
jgi:hypothetical protein